MISKFNYLIAIIFGMVIGLIGTSATFADRGNKPNWLRGILMSAAVTIVVVFIMGWQWLLIPRAIYSLILVGLIAPIEEGED